MIRKRNLLRALRKAFLDPMYAVTVFRKRLYSYLTYKFGKGYSAYPETVSLFLTYKCNLRCKMCGQWGENGWARKLPKEVIDNEITIERLERLVDDLAEFKPSITLFGGEPFLYSHWEDLVCYIKSKGMRVNVITNGTILSRYVEKVVDLGVDELIFSLDGPEEIHDEMRSGKGTFNRATTSFLELDEYKKITGKRNPKVNISATIFEINYRRLDEVIEVAESMNADTITFHHLIFQSPDICAANQRVFQKEFGLNNLDWIGFARDTLPDIDTEYLINKLHELTSRKSKVSVSVYPNYTDDEIRKYYTSFEFKSESYSPRCVSPWMTVYIFPNGDVKPCLDTCFVGGNIMRENFREIWNSQHYKQYQSKVNRFFTSSQGLIAAVPRMLSLTFQGCLLKMAQ
ncbi:Antilisterial bacteriocin subtilosin biosynthesis protein AlbA [subsurface metagenome]